MVLDLVACTLSCSAGSISLQPYGLQPAMGFSRQDTRVGCYFLLQEIFLTQELNPNLCLLALAGGFLTTEHLRMYKELSSFQDFNFHIYQLLETKQQLGLASGAVVKECSYQYRKHKRLRFHPGVEKIPWESTNKNLQRLKREKLFFSKSVTP